MLLDPGRVTLLGCFQSWDLTGILPRLQPCSGNLFGLCPSWVFVTGSWSGNPNGLCPVMGFVIRGSIVSWSGNPNGLCPVTGPDFAEGWKMSNFYYANLYKRIGTENYW